MKFGPIEPKEFSKEKGYTYKRLESASFDKNLSDVNDGHKDATELNSFKSNTNMISITASPRRVSSPSSISNTDMNDHEQFKDLKDLPLPLSRRVSSLEDDAKTMYCSSVEDFDMRREERTSRRRHRSRNSNDKQAFTQHLSPIDSARKKERRSKNKSFDHDPDQHHSIKKSKKMKRYSSSDSSTSSSSGSTSDSSSENDKKEEGGGGGGRCPVAHGVLSNCVSPRYRRMKNPIFWFSLNFLVVILLVWMLAKRYTQQLCERRTEFINAGRIYGKELKKEGWRPPSYVSHLISTRRGSNKEEYTFVSGQGNYDFMIKSNYKICSSAMPQLQCDCSSEVAGSGCEIMQKLGMGGFLIRDADYRSDPLSMGGPKSNNPCQNIFNDCVLDGFSCDNYYGVDNGCPIMPLGDIIGNHVIRDYANMTDKAWAQVGRCDERELCNGITGVQYLVCKTWKEALPMALAWVAIIEALVAVTSFIIFFVLLRYRDKNGKRKWRPCAPLTVADVKQMINVMVPNDDDRRNLYEQLRNSQVSMGLRDFGPSVPFTGRRNPDGKPADGFGKMTWPNGDMYEGEWKYGQMHGVGLFIFANGCTYKGEMKNGLRNGIGCFTFSRRKFEYDWSDHRARLGRGKVTAPTQTQVEEAHQAKRNSVNIPIDIVYERQRQKYNYRNRRDRGKSSKKHRRKSHKSKYSRKKSFDYDEKDHQFFYSGRVSSFDVESQSYIGFGGGSGGGGNNRSIRGEGTISGGGFPHTSTYFEDHVYVMDDHKKHNRRSRVFSILSEEDKVKVVAELEPIDGMDDYDGDDNTDDDAYHSNESHKQNDRTTTTNTNTTIHKGRKDRDVNESGSKLPRRRLVGLSLSPDTRKSKTRRNNTNQRLVDSHTEDEDDDDDDQHKHVTDRLLGDVDVEALHSLKQKEKLLKKLAKQQEEENDEDDEEAATFEHLKAARQQLFQQHNVDILGARKIEGKDTEMEKTIAEFFFGTKLNKKGKKKLRIVCINWKNGDQYIGKWKYGEGIPGDGYGIMQWSNGDVYEGRWYKGQPVQGIPQWQSRYTGEFKNGQEDGLGRYVWRDKLTGENGDEWDGEWKQGEVTWRGVYTRKADGKMLFENKWEKGEKHESRIGIIKWKGKEYHGEYCWDHEMESADHNDLFFSHSCSRSLGVCRNVCILVTCFILLVYIINYFLSMSASSISTNHAAHEGDDDWSVRGDDWLV